MAGIPGPKGTKASQLQPGVPPAHFSSRNGSRGPYSVRLHGRLPSRPIFPSMIAAIRRQRPMPLCADRLPCSVAGPAARGIRDNPLQSVYCLN